MCHIFQIMRNILSSAAESELAVLHPRLAKKLAGPIRACLEELGHPQLPIPSKPTTVLLPASPRKQSNKTIPKQFLTCAFTGFATTTSTKADFMCTGWRRGILNRADYFSKHHPATHHQQIRSPLLLSPFTAHQMIGQKITLMSWKTYLKID
jgi:hypothetical protein